MLRAATHSSAGTFQYCAAASTSARRAAAPARESVSNVQLTLQLPGEDLRERRPDTLAHLGLRDVDGHEPIGCDRHRGVRVECGRARGAAHAVAEGEPERHADARRGAALQEVPAVQLCGHGYTPAARLMARLMRTYVAHRQMLPDIAATISSSVGFGVLARSDAACMICPDWQYPHCGTCSAIQASWSGCRPWGCNPSIVVIFLPAACAIVVWQERTAVPS